MHLHPARPKLLIDDRDVDKASQMHERQNVVQRVPQFAVGHSDSRHVSNSYVTQNSMATSDLPHDVGLCNNARHRPFAVTGDEKCPMCAARIVEREIGCPQNLKV